MNLAQRDASFSNFHSTSTPLQSAILPGDLAHRASLPRHLYAPVTITRESEGICMSPMGFAVAMAVAVALIAAVTTVLLMLNRREK